MGFTYNLSQIAIAAQFVIQHASKYKLWCFYGQMGSGKTTLIKEICNCLNVTDNVNSPTFSLVNEYKTQAGEKIFHFDFYRIKSIDEVYDIGYEDYFYSNSLCLIEWPELVEPVIPKEISCKINIHLHEAGRVVSVQPNL
ncbi:MAG: tRNA (adenosine(37)-N6)-threonylcarbamoyltransferase complex ATPase subunit type 1 TsaE [Bacteroidia bacterium]